MIPDSGIGMMYLPGLENLIELFSKEIHVLELEPQTTWYKNNLEDDSFRFDLEISRWLKEFNKPVIFHGVGFPVGGTIKADQNHFHTMNEHMDFLKPLFISEHLSFNKYAGKDEKINQLNFLLPVIQNKAGIDTAVENIKHYKKNISLPFAFETGVNYLKPLKKEVPDGYFFREVAEKSDSFILLDLHNLLVNEINGRQKINDLIKMLPHERVIEIHLGGGHFYNNYYLDSHSNISSDQLFEVTHDIVGQLPNLKAIIFEMIPEYYNRTISPEALRKQFEEMLRIWDARGKKCKLKIKKVPYAIDNDESITQQEWENTLGNVIDSTPYETDITAIVKNDNGLKIIKDLIFEFRVSSIVSALKITCRYIKLMTDSNNLNKLLKEYCINNPSEIFGFANGKRFANFIKEKKTEIRYIDQIIDFEIAAMNSVIDGKNRIINLSFEPFKLLESLIENKKPEWSNITEDVIYQTELTNINLFESGSDALMKMETVYHN